MSSSFIVLPGIRTGREKLLWLVIRQKKEERKGRKDRIKKESKPL